MQVVFKKSVDRIISGCCEGNLKSQRALYDMFSDKMFGICLRYCKNKQEAEDVLQEGFIKVFKKIDTYKGDGSFEGWMRRVFVNTALRSIDNAKKNNYHESIEEFHHLGDWANFASNIDYKLLIGFVDELPAGYQLVFKMYAIEGFSHKEIAKELNISEGTSKSQLSRARNILQKKIEKQYLSQHLLKRG